MAVQYKCVCVCIKNVLFIILPNSPFQLIQQALKKPQIKEEVLNYEKVSKCCLQRFKSFKCCLTERDRIYIYIYNKAMKKL